MWWYLDQCEPRLSVNSKCRESIYRYCLLTAGLGHLPCQVCEFEFEKKMMSPSL